MGVVGNDRLGDVLLEQLSAFPITLLARRENVNTSVSLVLVEASGERHFIYQPQSNRTLAYRHIDEDAVRNAAFLSVGGCLTLPGLDGEGMLRLLDLAHKAGTRTALDFNVTDYMLDPATLKALLSRTDYALPSEVEARALTGEGKDPAEMVRRLRALGATNCIIKLGGKGCYVAADGYEGIVPPCPCRCLDTTGAGDTFVAAFLYARTRGWDILRCARFANAAGSIAGEHAGANGGSRSAAQVAARMA
jgi:sugar/nucleoside kinase (ribokinase family)